MVPTVDTKRRKPAFFVNRRCGDRPPAIVLAELQLDSASFAFLKWIELRAEFENVVFYRVQREADDLVARHVWNHERPAGAFNRDRLRTRAGRLLLGACCGRQKSEVSDSQQDE